MAAVVISVSHDGCGDYRTVQEAIDAVPIGNTCRTLIRVSPGVYRQPVYIPKTKNLITIAGFAPEVTVLSWDNTASKIEHHQASRIIGTGTFGCGTVIVEGEDFIAENVTFENSAPQGSGQAVAIRVTADRCAFYNCRFLGWQDTLYLHYGKQYLRDCYVEGSVDFIFGNSTALLEHCHIHCKSAGYITAQSRKSSQETTGYVFLRCVITGNGGNSYTYLGRPWGPFGRVVFAYTYMDACIKQAGWDNWGKSENERSACFYEFRYIVMTYEPYTVNQTSEQSDKAFGSEDHVQFLLAEIDTLSIVGLHFIPVLAKELRTSYQTKFTLSKQCFGQGSCPVARVNWARELLDEEAGQFIMHCFIDPNPERPWLAEKMCARIPYSA